MMSPASTNVQRCPDGSIDTSVYKNRAHLIRSKSTHNALKTLISLIDRSIEKLLNNLQRAK